MPHSSPLSPRTVVVELLRFVVLVVIFFICFALGGSLIASKLPANVPEPGPLPVGASLLLVSAASVLVVVAMLRSSRWHGLKLMAAMSLAYYGAVTFLMQLESWYFLYGRTIGPDLMPLMFLQGVPVAFVFVPLAVLVLGRARRPAEAAARPAPAPIDWKAWAWKLPLIAVAYIAFYFAAGYFIAWQNPALRAFYGEPGAARPFLAHMAHVVGGDPWLIPFQFVRGLLWAACAMPLLRGTRWPLWATALVVGLLFAVPQNLGHLLPNNLLPVNSVRLSHMVETASSMFVFGLLTAWLLYPKLAPAAQGEAQPGPLRPAQQAR